MLKSTSSLKRTTALVLGALTVFAAIPEAEARPHYDYWYGGHGRYWHDDYRYRSGAVYIAPQPVYQNYYYDQPPIYGYDQLPARVVTSNCVNQYDPSGTIIGATGGGLLGAAVSRGHGRAPAIVAGALIGGLLGSQYTSADRYCTREVFAEGPIGVPTQWHNPNTGYDYVVTPTREFENGNQYCREYQATTRIGGKPRESYGTACQQPDGSWKIVN